MCPVAESHVSVPVQPVPFQYWASERWIATSTRVTPDPEPSSDVPEMDVVAPVSTSFGSGAAMATAGGTASTSNVEPTVAVFETWCSARAHLRDTRGLGRPVGGAGGEVVHGPVLHRRCADRFRRIECHR